MSASAPAAAATLDDALDDALSGRPTRSLFSELGGLLSDPSMRGFFFENGLQFAPSEKAALDRVMKTTVGKRLTNRLGSPGAALSTIERFSLEALAMMMKKLGRSTLESRLIVVPRRHDRPPALMHLTPNQTYRGAEVISDKFGWPLTMLSEALFATTSPNDRDLEALALNSLRVNPLDATREIFAIAQPEIVETRRPRMIPLCVSAPHTRLESGAQVSTAGIFCSDAQGNIGVTGCYHGTGGIGTSVRLNLRQYSVMRASPVQDLVFIELGPGFNTPPMVGCKGVRSDREPARADYATFDGATNQNQRTRIIGCDAGILRARPSIQLKLQTNPDTDCGDSGCALLDHDELVIGFAFERTAYDDFPQFTDWIWANNALRALELTPFSM